RRHADVHELLEGAVGRDHAEGSPAGVDELDGRLDDALEHVRELELADHVRHGVEQTTQAWFIGGGGHASSLPEGPHPRRALAPLAEQPRSGPPVGRPEGPWARAPAAQACEPRSMNASARYVVGVDGSAPSEAALAWAVRNARRDGASL